MLDLYILLEDDTCVFLTVSSNPPADPDSDGCIGIYAYDRNGIETGDCGEMDYQEGSYETMEDAVADCLSFAELPDIPYTLITEEEFYKRVG